MKLLILAALLASPIAQAQDATDGFWFAENLTRACDALLKVSNGDLPPPTEGDAKEQAQAAVVLVGCTGYALGFAEAVAALPRYEINGVCIEAKQKSFEGLTAQIVQTAADHPEMVATGAPSAALMLRAMEDAYPCK